MNSCVFDPRANAVSEFVQSVRILRSCCINAKVENNDKLITALTSSSFTLHEKDEGRFLRMRFTELTEEKDEYDNLKRVKHDTELVTKNINTLDNFNKIISTGINGILESKKLPEPSSESISAAYTNYTVQYQNIASLLAYFKKARLDTFE